MTKQTFRTKLLCATILMSSAATPALAQEAADGATATNANEIVVTATRRSTTLQDVPINISAVGQEQLTRNRIDDVQDLAAFTPGMTVRDTGPSSTGNIVLRGISSDDASGGSAYESAVGVYLGEVPLYLDFKLIDIARVEVLQGPQGTLYGLGTLAGAVRYIPNRPDSSKFTVDAHARVFDMAHASDPGFVMDGTINIPIIADHVAFRSTTGYYNVLGFIDNNALLLQPGVSDPQPGRSPTGAGASLGTAAQRAANFYSKKDVNDERTLTTRNQLLLELNPDIKAYLTYAHQETKTGGDQANSAGVLGTGKYENATRYLEPRSRNADLYAAEFNIALGGFAQVVSTSAWTTQDIDQVSDNTDLLLDLNYGYEAFPQFSSFNTSAVKYRQFNQEVRLVSTHGGPLSWVLGGFYNNLRSGSQYREYTPGLPGFFGVFRPDNLEYMSFVNTRTKEMAAYGEATFHITDAWQVTGGLRYYKYKAFAEGATDTPLTAGGIRRTPYPLVQFTPSRIRSGNTDDDGFVWKANTSYKFNDDLLLYGTYSTGYRTGNVNRVAPCIQPLPPGQNVCALPNELGYGPDKTKNIEIGLRASLLDKRLQFTVDAFHVDWTDLQTPSQTINGAVGITVNAGKARSQGVEFSGEFRITPELTLRGTYSYTDAQLTEDAADIVVSQGVPNPVFDGDRLPSSTKHQGSAQLTYTYPLANGADIEASWAATYTGNIYSRIGLRGNGEVIPDYMIHRASVTYHGEHFDLGIFADNIFDNYAITGVQNDVSSFNQVRTDVVERYYGYNVLTPRRIGVDMRFHY
ncbi:outer membrane receptor protein involved in Fe transport [Novosphingobium chloroacetimidivorans]|uniref:Outer membrane receptor protein involved in Fe transport n=1 Tax=Novosphingobium chloroacetimidivorans TaxID=1428314 RepID=A0A7W7NW39_9SPHN|nr:TonB-dependent receptor [Novosphingobium chloroacetimidivorans]MBB4858951.1 outer membrane receptor protein involved in Fe transport [Novosphingobium chloroacetimidivorans]